MNEPDLNNLRAILDEYQAYADSIAGPPERAAIIDQMRSAIADARRALLPSPDGTANYVETKAIVERLAELRNRSSGTPSSR